MTGLSFLKRAAVFLLNFSIVGTALHLLRYGQTHVEEHE
jgi:hypothetical protein